MSKETRSFLDEYTERSKGTGIHGSKPTLTMSPSRPVPGKSGLFTITVLANGAPVASAIPSTWRGIAEEYGWGAMHRVDCGWYTEVSAETLAYIDELLNQSSHCFTTFFAARCYFEKFGHGNAWLLNEIRAGRVQLREPQPYTETAESDPDGRMENGSGREA